MTNTFLDSFVNPYSGWGATGTSIADTRYFREAEIEREELYSLYMTSWLARKAVEVPVDDMLSKGIDYGEEEGQKSTEMEELFNKLNLWPLIKKSLTYARLTGGSLLFFDYGDDHSSPRFSFSYKEIKSIKVYDRFSAFPKSFYNSAVHGEGHPKIGIPEHYTLHNYGYGDHGTIVAHNSRLIRVEGLEVPEIERIRLFYWGASVLKPCYKEIKRYEVGMGSMGSVLQNYNKVFLKIKDLATHIQNDEDLGQRNVLNRVELAFLQKHSERIGIMGDDEEVQFFNYNLSGMPEVTDRQANEVCASIDPGIPHSRLFSAEGGALGGSSAESDMDNYYSKIGSKQEEKVRPLIDSVCEMLGVPIPKYKFNQLREKTDMQRLEEEKLEAEVEQIKADTEMTKEVDHQSKDGVQDEDFDSEAEIFEKPDDK